MEYVFDELSVGLACHPSTASFCVGFIDGSVVLYNYECSTDELKVNELWRKKHKAAVRKIRFSKTGDRVYALTKNKAFTQWDAETGKKSRCIRVAHDSAPYSMCVVNENQTATGDEDGTIKFWDWRSTDNPCSFQLTETDEYITDLIAGENGKILLATCGDCTLISIDTRKKKLILQSEPMHSELLSLVSACGEKKLLCGAANGYLEVFNWGEWGNLVERISTNHKDTVDCLLALDENLIVSASADGTIRSISILPNKSLGVLGRHDDGVEDLALTHDRNYLVSCGQDSKVKFWDVNTIKSAAPKTNSGSNLKKLMAKKHKGNFFDDLEEVKVKNIK